MYIRWLFLVESSQNTTVLFDTQAGIYKEGKFVGAIIIRTNDTYSSLIVSDNAVLESGEVTIKGGLIIGFEGKDAFSRELDLTTPLLEKNPHKIEYIVLVGDDIIQQFDEGSFSHAFPYTISFLHTAGITHISPQNPVDHLEFVRGEILARPIARFIKDDMVTFADRLVIDQNGDPVFYDSFTVKRDGSQLTVEYDPIFAINDVYLKYLLVIGSETLKK